MYSHEVFPLLLLLSTLHPVQPDCMPAEEGQETILKCTVNTAALACPSSTLLEWRANQTTVVIECNSNGCSGGYSLRYGFSATINNNGSTLTIPRVSRTDPINMETGWTCWPCGDSSREVTACDKLEVYDTPSDPRCRVIEIAYSPGDVESARVSCFTTRVYPKAKCTFKRGTNGGTFVTINKTPTYNTTPITGTPVYYMSECSVDVPVAELGEGTHSFTAFIYPDVTDGINLVDETEGYNTVTFTLPETTFYFCTPEMVQGYFNGKYARCICSPRTTGYPIGHVWWFKGNQTVTSSTPINYLDVSFDSSDPEQNYTCKGVSAIGEGPGSNLTAKFAFFEEVAVIIESSTSIIDLCGETNYTNTRIPITCRVPKDKIYPAPIFNVSYESLAFVFPEKDMMILYFTKVSSIPVQMMAGCTR